MMNTLVNFPFKSLPENVLSPWRLISDAETIPPDYLGPAFLAAASSAIGASLRLHIKGSWHVSPIMYLLLVGYPGCGKTPAIRAAFRPLFDQYFNMESNPSLLFDASPEAIFSALANNPRGITIITDEFMALAKPMIKGTDSNLLQHLLSAWNESPLRLDRSNNPPVIINLPSLNMVGGIQTSLLHRIFKSDLCYNGFLNRISFAMPKVNVMYPWRETEADPNYHLPWRDVILKLASLPYDQANPKILQFTPEAKTAFFDWKNKAANDFNAYKRLQELTDFDFRNVKDDTKIPRFALIVQALKWATGASDNLEYVDKESLLAAIDIARFFDSSYFLAYNHRNFCNEFNLYNFNHHDLWNALPENFTSALAVEIGSLRAISQATIYRWLKQLASENKIYRPKNFAKGYYLKITPQSINQPNK